MCAYCITTKNDPLIFLYKFGIGLVKPPLIYLVSVVCN